jgi:hypothetical protein
VDSYSGQRYEHRRGWVEKRLLFLSTLFAIDICAYAVISSHVTTYMWWLSDVNDFGRPAKLIVA